jgi:membrane protease YdiL (CAAX protease family)
MTYLLLMTIFATLKLDIISYCFLSVFIEYLQMKLRAWFQSVMGVVGIGLMLTLIVLGESIFPPWAPYFIVYAFLAILIPLALKTYKFGSFRVMLSSKWKLILSIFIVALLVDEGIANWLYQRILDSFGVGSNSFYSLNAAINVLIGKTSLKFDITRDTTQVLYALFLVVWAPIGEELFYRGYMQGVLRQTRSFGVSALVSATFFGIRHATHLFFLWPNVPWIAAANWVVSAFVFGWLMSYLYEKTGSLYPPMVVHAVVNLIEIALSP